jgi:hypothetical protein
MVKCQTKVTSCKRYKEIWVVQIAKQDSSQASMIKGSYDWYVPWSVNKCDWIICTLVQVGDLRKYALEENNKGLIFIFHIVHNNYNTML